MSDKKPTTLGSFDQVMKDHYPRAGEQLKQYVADARREDAWQNETAPSVFVSGHNDNTLVPCRNSGDVRYHELDHDACDICGALHAAFAREPRIKVWLDEKAKRPPICGDRTKLSDEVAPGVPGQDINGMRMRIHPMFKVVKSSL